MVGQPGACLIGMEACAGAHHLARALAAQGHDVRLMPGQYVKPFVKTHKNDLTDAEAIAEAVQRPQMRFVPVKTPAQLDVQALHRARDRLVGMRTALVNQIRGFLLERGIAVARGRRTLEKALPGLLEDHAEELGALLRGLIECLRAQWRAIDQPIASLDEQILALARQDATSQRLMVIPGVGPMLATALVAAVGSGAAGFQNGRSLAALRRRRRSADPCGTGSMPLASMAGPDPTPAQQRRQGPAARGGPLRQPLSAPAPRPCGALAEAGGARPRRPAGPLAAGVGRPGARQCCRGGPGRQARPLLPAGICRCPPLRGWIDRAAVDGRSWPTTTTTARRPEPARQRIRVLLGKG